MAGRSSIGAIGAWLWSSRINDAWRLPLFQAGRGDDEHSHHGLAAWLQAPCVLPPAQPGESHTPKLNARYRRVARRASPMSRSVLYLHQMLNARDAPMVFASEHGELRIATELLSQIVHGEPLSPAGFSHSVHSAAVGLAALVADTRKTTSMIAAGLETLHMGLLEASALAIEQGACVLFVADDVAPPALAPVASTPEYGFAMAIQLASEKVSSKNSIVPAMSIHDIPVKTTLEATVFNYFHALGQGWNDRHAMPNTRA